MGETKRLTSQPDVEVVTEPAQLDELCSRITRIGTFAFDTEFIKEGTFEPVVCLMQVATEDNVFLVDPLVQGLDVGPLWSRVGDARTEVVVHAGMEDMALCYRCLGRPPERVFDVQIAAGLVGFDYPLSLTRLVREVLGLRLHKSQTLSDWRRRPLSEVQRRYAVEDVAHLPATHRILRRRLATMGRESWATEEFGRFAIAETYGPTPENPLTGIKGAGSLDPRGLAIAQELARERVALARHLNRPVRAVLRDHLLVEIARRGWTSLKEIRTLRGIQLSDRAVRRLADAVRRARALPAEQLPVPNVPVEETPDEAVVIALMTAVIRAVCLEKQVAYSLVCSKQDIRSLVLAHVRKQARVTPGARRGSAPLERNAASPSQGLTGGWRHEVLRPVLERVLSGRAATRLTGPGPCPRLSFE